MSPEERKLSRVEIEVASEKDIPAIIDVEERTWISSYPNEKAGIREDDIKARFNTQFKEKRATEIKDEMASEVHSYRVVKKGGRTIAYSHLLKEEEFGDLVEVYVLPSHQRMGIGGALIRDGLGWLGGDKPVRLEVAEYNPAIEIYKHYGFVDRPDLNQAEGEDWNVLPSGKRIPVKFMERPVK